MSDPILSNDELRAIIRRTSLAIVSVENADWPQHPQALFQLLKQDMPALFLHMETMAAAHAARVTELLEANNREVERRREAEQAKATAIAAVVTSKSSFETYIRELRRSDIGDDADTLTEEDFVTDLAEPAWPDFCRWQEILGELIKGGELTPRQRTQALAYWEAGEEYPPDDMRLDPCAAEDCPLRVIAANLVKAPKE